MNGIAANTKDCFRTLVGRRIIGILFDALPLSDKTLRQGNKTLVLEDGSGFTISSSGSFWTETAADVQRAVSRRQAELRSVEADIREVLELAGKGSE